MDGERADTHLRLLAEAELRRAMAVPAGGSASRWHSARLALVAQALTVVDAIGADLAEQIVSEAGLAVAVRHRLPARGPAPGSARPAPRRTWWRVVPAGQVITIGDGGARREVPVVAFVQSAGGARLLVTEWPAGPLAFAAADDRVASYQVRWRGEMAPRELVLSPDPQRRIRWLDLTASTGQPATRIGLDPQTPAPAADVTVTRHAHSPGEVVLDALAARILTAAARAGPDNPGQPAAASGELRALGDGPGHITAALHAVGALPPESPVPGQLAAPCARLGLTGHAITAPPASGLPHQWQDMLTSREPRPPVPGIWAMAAAELPGLEGATIAIAGLHHGEHGTIMHLLATGVTLPAGWPYAIRPVPALWIRDSHGRCHTTRTDGIVSSWGDHGANPWTDTRMVTAWLQIIPPLDRGTTWIELSAAGRTAQIRVTLPLSPQ